MAALLAATQRVATWGWGMGVKKALRGAERFVGCGGLFVVAAFFGVFFEEFVLYVAGDEFV